MSPLREGTGLLAALPLTPAGPESCPAHTVGCAAAASVPHRAAGLSVS